MELQPTPSEEPDETAQDADPSAEDSDDSDGYFTVLAW